MLTIAPEDALIDVPRRIAASGLAAGEEVVVRARTWRGPGVLWQSAASFRADGRGEVDLQRDAPTGGSYAGVSAMGLIWSQAPEQAGASREVFAQEPAAALVTDVSVERQGSASLNGTLVQRLMGPGVTRRELREDGLVGTLFTPPDRADGRAHPAILVLNGSGGGINEPRAALYASHGYAALALGYFKVPGRPDYISNTPLEYFETALQWLHCNLRPGQGFVAVSGQSRGGELALLLGSLFPQLVSAVIGYVPAALVHSAQNACDPATGRDGPAWTLRGWPLPHLWQDNRTASWAPWDDGPPPRRHAHALLTALQDDAAVERARIHVEHIRGPVLLLSATDDGSWPSSLYSRMVVERLARFAHPHLVEHLDFEGAGHAILFPYVPTTQLVHAHPVSGRLSTTGGAPAANAHADEASWAGVRRFLDHALDQLTLKAAAMSASESASTASEVDVVDALVPLHPAHPLYAVRHQRDKVVAATQGSDDAIFDPALQGLSLAERLTAAETVARRSGSLVLASHYRERLGRLPAPARDGERLRAILAFTDILTDRPVDGDRDALLALPAAGLSTPEVIALAQLIAFVAYQVRVVAGLQAMAAMPPDDDAADPQAQPAAPTAFIHPANLPQPGEPVRVNGYTSETLGWKAWLPVVDLALATPEQMAVLESSHPKAKTSDYYRVLVHQPRILHERSAVFNAIMYAPGGLSRAERELASAAVSRVNGCVYCASVHAQRFEQLAKRNDVIVQLFTEPRGAGSTARERAVIQLAIDLTLEPGAFGPAQLQAARAAGLTSLEVLDAVHATAIFAWANRLMLNLGEPVFPTDRPGP